MEDEQTENKGISEIAVPLYALIITVVLVGLTAGVVGAYIAVHKATIEIYPYKAVFKGGTDIQVTSESTEISELGVSENTGTEPGPLRLDNDNGPLGSPYPRGYSAVSKENYIFTVDFEENSMGSAPEDTTWKVEVYIDHSLNTTFWVETPSTDFKKHKGGIRLTVDTGASPPSSIQINAIRQ